jgi:hypothetical protein
LLLALECARNVSTKAQTYTAPMVYDGKIKSGIYRP